MNHLLRYLGAALLAALLFGLASCDEKSGNAVTVHWGHQGE